MKPNNPKPKVQKSPASKKLEHSRVRFGNFTADYTSEPLEYRRQLFKWVLIYHLVIVLAITLTLTILAVFAPSWAFLSTAGTTGLAAGIRFLKGRSP